jgi:hypothetical protein
MDLLMPLDPRMMADNPEHYARSEEARYGLTPDEREQVQDIIAQRYLDRMALLDAHRAHQAAREAENPKPKSAKTGSLVPRVDTSEWPSFLVTIHAKHEKTFGANVGMCQHTECLDIRRELLAMERRPKKPGRKKQDATPAAREVVRVAREVAPVAREDVRVTRVDMGGRPVEEGSERPRTSGRWMTERGGPRSTV